MSNLYRKRDDSRSAFTTQLFKTFCDKIGHGDPVDFAAVLYGRYTVEDFSMSDDAIYWAVHEYFTDVVIPHKIAVFNAGKEWSGKRWFYNFIQESDELWTDNLFLHDVSKFSAVESFGYAFHDFKKKDFDPAFEKSWNHHKQHNEHHPEHWISVDRQGKPTFLAMPKICIAEMVADWIGAGQTYGNTLEKWLPDNLHKFRFNIQTASNLQFFLHKIGVETDLCPTDHNAGCSLSCAKPTTD